MGLSSLGMSDMVKTSDTVLVDRGGVDLVDNGVVLVSVHISNDGGEGFLHVIDSQGNSASVCKINSRTTDRDINFDDMQMYWKDTTLKLVKTNNKGEISIMVRFIKGVRFRLLDWDTWRGR